MKLGNVATGKDFFDRERIREDIWRYLEDNHLILRGVRRLGKSSILRKIEEEAAEKELLSVYKDVGGAKTAEEFLTRLEEVLPNATVMGYLEKKSKSALEWISRVDKIKVGLPGAGEAEIELKDQKEYSWYKRAIAFQKRITKVPVIIQIDEFSVFLEKLLESDPEEADALLSWLRAWRQSTQTVCRFIFTGSIGINYLLDCHKLSTRLNDCHELVVKPFLGKDAKAMIVTQAERQEWEIETKTVQHLCDRTGWLSPYFVNLLLDQSMLAARDRVDELEIEKRMILEQDVDDGYERLIALKSRFVHWETRLSETLINKDFIFCKDILTAVAKSKEGLTLKQLISRLAKREADPDKREEKIKDLLNKLEDEGYIAPPNNKKRFVFLSFLLKDYWVRNHV